MSTVLFFFPALFETPSRPAACRSTAFGEEFKPLPATLEALLLYPCLVKLLLLCESCSICPPRDSEPIGRALGRGNRVFANRIQPFLRHASCQFRWGAC